MNLARIFALIGMCCLLAVSAAVSASHAAGTGQYMVLCIGGQEQTVEIGVDGEPINRVTHCPECVTLHAMPFDRPTVAEYGLVESKLNGVAQPAQLIIRLVLRSSARGPPLMMA